MKDILFGRQAVLLAVTTILLLFVMAFFSAQRVRETSGENLVEAMLSPVQGLVTASTGGVRSFFGHFADTKALETRNSQLLEQVIELENANRELQSYKEENERLSEMLDLRENLREYHTIAAQVIAKNPGNWFNSFTINKGTNDGVAFSQAVITTRGVVGFVSEVGGGWAKVSVIIDPKNSIGGVIVRTRDVVVVDGDTVLQLDGLCKMSNIPKGADITAGDLIETSGLGGVYPQGLLIGKVSEVKTDMHGMSQSAVVEPAVDFGRINEVLIITK